MAVGGIISGLRRRRSKKGDWWASLSLEGLAGQIEVLVFPKAYAGCQTLLEDEKVTLINGRYEVDDDRRRIIADAVCPIDELIGRRAEAVELRFDAGELSDELVERLRGTVEEHRGEAPLYLEVARAGAYRLRARARPAFRVQPSKRLDQDLRSIVGSGAVRYRGKAPA